jgi:hypothetical protein
LVGVKVLLPKFIFRTKNVFFLGTTSAIQNQCSLIATLIEILFYLSNYSKYEASAMFGAPERPPTFGACTFPSIKTTCFLQYLNEKKYWYID